MITSSAHVLLGSYFNALMQHGTFALSDNSRMQALHHSLQGLTAICTTGQDAGHDS